MLHIFNNQPVAPGMNENFALFDQLGLKMNRWAHLLFNDHAFSWLYKSSAFALHNTYSCGCSLD